MYGEYGDIVIFFSTEGVVSNVQSVTKFWNIIVFQITVYMDDQKVQFDNFMRNCMLYCHATQLQSWMAFYIDWIYYDVTLWIVYNCKQTKVFLFDHLISNSIFDDPKTTMNDSCSYPTTYNIFANDANWFSFQGQVTYIQKISTNILEILHFRLIILRILAIMILAINHKSFS